MGNYKLVISMLKGYLTKLLNLIDCFHRIEKLLVRKGTRGSKYSPSRYLLRVSLCIFMPENIP